MNITIVLFCPQFNGADKASGGSTVYSKTVLFLFRLARRFLFCYISLLHMLSNICFVQSGLRIIF